MEPETPGKPRVKKNQKNEEKMQRKYERSINKDTGQPKPRKELRKLTELKNPSCATVDLRQEKALGLQKRTRDEPNELTQLLRPGLLLPAREHQTRETLGVTSQYVKEMAQPALQGSSTLYDQILECNRRRHSTQSPQVFPLEELVRQGLLSTNLLSLDQRQDALAQQCRVDTDFIVAQLRQLHRTGITGQRLQQTASLNTLTASQQRGHKKRGKNANNDDIAPNSCSASQVKLSIRFGSHDETFAFERRYPNEKREHTFRLFDQENARLEAEFFAYDQLELDVPFQVRSTRYKMTRQLTEENATRYKEKDQLTRDGSLLVPRPHFETISREYITQYRYRPEAGAQLCFNGHRCLSYTFSPDPNIRYVGRAFYTQRQCDQLKRGESLDANEEGLCYDCLLLEWTRCHERHVTHQQTPLTFFNHFGVRVGPGQYPADCMLEPVFNGKETGIMGCVPRYDEKKRHINYITRRRLVMNDDGITGVSEPIQEAFVGEIGMDFWMTSIRETHV